MLAGEGAPLPASVLRRMTSVLEHRGPDEGGVWSGPGVGLGVRRLAIVDVVGGSQPVMSGPVVAVQNGELYNHLELRRRMAGRRFASRCDSEVLPHAYAVFGPRFPALLAGAIFDAPR